MTTHEIHQVAAEFNARTDYSMAKALTLCAVLVRHAHLVQMARMEKADPQLMLGIDEATQ